MSLTPRKYYICGRHLVVITSQWRKVLSGKNFPYKWGDFKLICGFSKTTTQWNSDLSKKIRYSGCFLLFSFLTWPPKYYMKKVTTLNGIMEIGEERPDLTQTIMFTQTYYSGSLFYLWFSGKPRVWKWIVHLHTCASLWLKFGTVQRLLPQIIWHKHFR